jgi:pimeloyl-ACP methyl ester carboxylesterase
MAKGMARIIDNVTLKTLETGHASAIEAPEEFNQAVLDFMKRL